MPSSDGSWSPESLKQSADLVNEISKVVDSTAICRRHPSEANCCKVDEIDLLRGALHRRNELLGAILKAYHRDVLVVKESLYRAEQHGFAVGDLNIEGAHMNSSLSSVPSVDLSETLRLFSPHECDLRVDPCYHCGGTVEIVHRESSRLAECKHIIQEMKERDEELRLEMADVRVRAHLDRERVVEAAKKHSEDRQSLLGRILDLGHRVSDRDDLFAEVERLTLEKHRLSSELKCHEPVLREHERLKVEVQESKDECKILSAELKTQEAECLRLEQQHQALIDDMQRSGQEIGRLELALVASGKEYERKDKECDQLANDLAKSKTRASEIEACLQKAQFAYDEMAYDFDEERDGLKENIECLESTCSDLRSDIARLESESKHHASEAENFRKRIASTLEGARRRGSISFVPQGSEAAFDKTDDLFREVHTLRQKSAGQSNLLISCIRSFYENCHFQERELLLKNGGALHKNTQKLQQSEVNSAAKSVLDHLDSEDESDAIDWASILSSDTDQRHILGNLENRLRMGQFSIGNTFDQVHKRSAGDLLKCKESHEKDLQGKVSAIWELERQLQDSLSLNRSYEEKLTKLRGKFGLFEPKFEALRRFVLKIRSEYIAERANVNRLSSDCSRLSSTITDILERNQAKRDEVAVLEAKLQSANQDVAARDAAIEQMEGLVQRLSANYARQQKIITVPKFDACVQVAPHSVDASVHVDFMKSNNRGKQGMSVSLGAENKLPLDEFQLLPGRLFDALQNEKFPSRFGDTVVPNCIQYPSRFEYRRAIDKL